jgi:hypothetical protein
MSAEAWPGYVLPTWTTPAAIAAAAMAQLGLSSADPDAASVTTAATSAILLVDGYLGTPDMAFPEPAPQPIIDATVGITVEVYRRKDAAYGVLNTWSGPDFGPVRISTDWLKGWESVLHPYMRDSFGIG